MGSFDKWSVLVELGLFMGWLMEQEEEEYRIYIPPFLPEEEEISQADLMNTTCMACFKADKMTQKVTEEYAKARKPIPAFVAEIFEKISPSQTKERMKHYKKSGIPEYWLIDLEKNAVYKYAANGEGYGTKYTFADMVPVAILQNKVSVDFKEINRNCLEVRSKEFPHIWED